MSETEHTSKGAAKNLLDLRRIIGGLLFLYGLILTIVGIVGSDESKTKAAGENVNLWTGLGLLVVGGLFIAWSLLSPFEELDQFDNHEDAPSAEDAPVDTGSGSDEPSSA